MKRTIKWYQDCLINSRASAERLREQIAELNARLNRLDRDNEFRAYQIDSAIKEDKDGFDGEKYKAKERK